MNRLLKRAEENDINVQGGVVAYLKSLKKSTRHLSNHSQLGHKPSGLNTKKHLVFDSVAAMRNVPLIA